MSQPEVAPSSPQSPTSESYEQRTSSPMSTMAEAPTSVPPETNNELAPRTECLDYSDGNVCGRYTCCGLPLVDGFTRYTMLSQHDPIQVAMWDGIRGPKALCWLANPYSFTEENALQTLRDAITAILPAGTEFKLAQPIPSPLIARARPVAFLVWDLSEKEATLLTDREVWSIRSPYNIAFFAEDYDGPPSPFVYTAEGLWDKNAFGLGEIENLFRETIRNHPAVLEFTARFYDALHDESYAVPDYLLATCRVELTTAKDLATGETRDLWNFSMESPTAKPGLHAAWRRLIAAIPLVSLVHGPALAINNALLCAMCLGTSHMAEQCPWPKLRGWAGPNAKVALAWMSLPAERAARGIAGSGEAMLRNEVNIPVEEAETDEE